MSHNANLMYDGWMRSQIPDLNSPSSAKDLIIDHYGYQLAGTVRTGTGSAGSTTGSTIVSSTESSTASTTGTATSAQLASKVVVEDTAAPLPTAHQVFSSTSDFEVSTSGGQMHTAFSQPIYQPHPEYFVIMA
jgi:hypothetical protein